MNKRELESAIVTDFSKRMSYGDYLCLDQLLDCQHPLSNPPHHDEMLFVIQHQTSELWMKLMLHELQAALRLVQQDKLSHCFKIGARQTDPAAAVRTVGGAGNADAVGVRRVSRRAGQLVGLPVAPISLDRVPARQQECGDAGGVQQRRGKHAALKAILEAPSLYDEYLLYLARHGLPIPQECLERDWTQPYQRNPDLLPAFKVIYDNPQTYWEAYEMAEKLVDIEESFHLWRFRHMKTVERIIGFKSGTGGSSGVSFLKKALDLTFFPELLDVRTEIGA